MDPGEDELEEKERLEEEEEEEEKEQRRTSGIVRIREDLSGLAPPVENGNAKVLRTRPSGLSALFRAEASIFVPRTGTIVRNRQDLVGFVRIWYTPCHFDLLPLRGRREPGGSGPENLGVSIFHGWDKS